jgi:glucosamine--fructose-6-phosphate aminotransferase (isomerizing)
VVTCARGSSDHAATFAKYLIETRAGVLTSSAAPSIASVYGARQDLRGCLFLAISQSGRSPDLVAATGAARDAGAIIVALVNEEDTPLAAAADHAIPLCAGAEESVPATKSFIAALGAIVHLVAEWTRDAGLSEALAEAPSGLERAWALDWNAALGPLEKADHLYVIARGPGLAIAQEAALKCKEVCALHAEAFSSAEVRHGPQALLGAGTPALLFAQDDEARPGIEALGLELVGRGVQVMRGRGASARRDRAADARRASARSTVLEIQSFYGLADALARARGLRSGPSAPPSQGHRDALMLEALTNARVLMGDALVAGHAVLLEAGRIAAVVPENDPRCARAARSDLGGGILLPDSSTPR